MLVKRKAGYSFELDFKAFRELKKLLSNSVAFVDAIKAVISMNLENKNSLKTPSVYIEEVRLSKHELHTVIKKAIEEEREILLDAFEKKINNALELRDRQLLIAMKHSLEEKQKEITASLEETKEKNWWNKIFSK